MPCPSDLCVVGAKIKSRNGCLARKLAKFSSLRRHAAARPNMRRVSSRIKESGPSSLNASVLASPFERGIFTRSQSTCYFVLTFCSSLSYTCHTILRFRPQFHIVLKQWIPISTIGHGGSYQPHCVISRDQRCRKNYGSMRFLYIPTFQFVQRYPLVPS
jgi:hypothetical protein